MITFSLHFCKDFFSKNGKIFHYFQWKYFYWQKSLSMSNWWPHYGGVGVMGGWRGTSGPPFMEMSRLPCLHPQRKQVRKSIGGNQCRRFLRALPVPPSENHCRWLVNFSRLNYFNFPRGWDGNNKSFLESFELFWVFKIISVYVRTILTI